MSRGIAVGVGVVMIVLGVLSLLVGGIPYTRTEEVVDVGPIEASVETEEQVAIPGVAGVLLLVGGVGVLIYGARAGRG